MTGQGDILEVSVGTGRSIKYYPINKCKSITLVDASPHMLEETKRNFKGSQSYIHSLPPEVDSPYLCTTAKYPQYSNVTFLCQNATDTILSPSGTGFDFIVQSMGICSQEDPVRVLRNLESHCKPDGKIILLEHGRSYYQWLNSILDTLAPNHAKTWGCWFNRDIANIVEESQLRVLRTSRYHFGTTWWIEAVSAEKTTLERSGK